MTQASTFELAHAFTSRMEGGFVDHPSDPGGITNHGISLRFLKDYSADPDDREWLDRIGVRLPITPAVIRELTKERATLIFKRAFWDALHLDNFPRLPAIAQYDCAVNAGVRQAALLLQRAVYVPDDGVIGPVTRQALADACGKDGELAVSFRLCAQRRDFYAGIVRSKPNLAPFSKGWNNRVEALQKYLADVAL